MAGLSLMACAATVILGLACCTIPASAVAGEAAAVASSRGTVRGWGYNSYGQLGDGAFALGTTPVKFKLPRGVKVTSVRAGCYHALALTATGRVLAAGRNSVGQLGIGSTNNHDTPVYVKLPVGTKVTAVRAGCEFSLALTSTGRVLAWGDNRYGQLGDGTRHEHDTPARVDLPAGTKVKAISAGDQFGLALTTAGHILAWGRNNSGQLGNGTTTDSDAAVRVALPAGITVTAVSAGCLHSLALTSTGRVLGWGDNFAGELGNGSRNNSDTPVRAHLARGLVATAIGAGPGSENSFAIVRQR
jgi:alpha-tubulin suppressor-like RCC1 family protein